MWSLKKMEIQKKKNGDTRVLEEEGEMEVQEGEE